ncbi:MAG: hypothetical protein JXB19_02040 [Bacteroidales bacterium]|nr:hypothetical protein [Bacteroidales bacterium]
MTKRKLSIAAGKVIIAWLILPLFFTALVSAQDDVSDADTTRKNAIRLFMDCQSCDMNYMREEMPYINYVRDVREAQVYLQVTRQSTGSGGSEYTLFYSGQENFEGIKDTLTYSSSPDDTQDITRTGLTNTIAAGLMRYVAKTPIIRNVSIRYEGETQEEHEQVADKWNFWVFDLETEPEFSLEKSEREYSWSNRISANRVTPEWKLQNNFNHSFNMNIFIREKKDEETGDTVEVRTEAIRKSWSFNSLTVKSIADHWSVGLIARTSSSTYSNLNLKIGLQPAIEYNIFPYTQSNQRQLVIRYSLGFIYNNYVDSTVYDQVEEKLIEQVLDISLDVEQRWGSVNISLGASNYLHDFRKNSVELDGYIRIRLFKGLSLNVNGGVALIHNQIELAKGGRSEQEIYLRLKELETNFRYDGGVGISYTFGSIYNNIVNPRFGGGGGSYYH